ncbi:MAG: hypothetical protein RL338_1461 [Chloroflexota bacterium]
MKVLVADKFEESGIAGLRAAGFDVVVDPSLADAALAEALRTSGAEVLVVRSTKVTAEMMDAGALALVVRAGAGYDTIDVAAASARGIHVSNCPGRNAIAVAELTLGLILALDRRIPDNVAELRAGRWDKAGLAKASGLHGRKLGLLGFGSIGVEVARRAVAFGMPVVVWSRRLSAALERGETVDLASYGLPTAGPAAARVAGLPHEVASAADVLSIHLSLGPETRGLVDAGLLAALRPGAIVVNTSRAEVVDHAALAVAVRERGLRVGLDVWPDEPKTGTAEFRPAILDAGLVYGTHHIGASTDQAQEEIAAETVRIVTTYAATGRVPNVVNLAARSPATHMLVVRHRDRPGVLAHVFEHLGSAGINVQETENVVFEGAVAAVARINLDHPPTPDQLAAIGDHAEILSLRVVEIR